MLYSTSLEEWAGTLEFLNVSFLMLYYLKS